MNGAKIMSAAKGPIEKRGGGAVMKSTCRSRRLGYNRIADSLSPRPCLWQSLGAGPRKTEGPRTVRAPGDEHRCGMLQKWGIQMDGNPNFNARG